MFAYWQELLLVLVGTIAGVLNVVAGGGSLLTVPVMVFIGMPGQVANGTNRIAILAQSITAIAAFFKRGFADFKLSLTLGLATVPGALLGAYAGVQLQGIWFNRVLAMVMLLVMVMMHWRPPAARAKHHITLSKARVVWVHILMMFVGIYGGFIQVGTGFLIMPILQHMLGLDLVRVNMHKVFIVACYTIAALYVFASQLQLMWLLGACLAFGNAIGGWLGAHMSVSKGERWIKRVLNAVLLVFVIKLLWMAGE